LGSLLSIELSVVAPVHRCESCLPELYRRLVATLERLTSSFEIILVNDGSPENDWQIIRDLAARDPRVKGVSLSRNFGQHTALTAGVDRAQGDWVVVMDSDLQDPPEEIEKLYRKAKEGFDVVFSRREVRQHNAFKRMTSLAFTRLLSYLTDTRLDNAVTHFSIASRSVALNFRFLRERNRSYAPLVGWLGFKVGYADIEHHSRYAGSSSYTFAKMLRLAVDMVVSQSDKPLRLSIRFGFAISLFAILYGLYQILRYFLWGYPVTGWTSMIVSIYFIGGLLFANLGVVGLYIGRIFDETRRRPLYIVSEVVNLPGTRPELAFPADLRREDLTR
jgi:glycosyltransferase involved in cell wall biosynthesis